MIVIALSIIKVISQFYISKSILLQTPRSPTPLIPVHCGGFSSSIFRKVLLYWLRMSVLVLINLVCKCQYVQSK